MRQVSWPQVALAELCDVQIGKTPPRARAEYWGPGHPWLSIADMSQGRRLVKTAETITDRAVSECNCRLVAPGTALLSFKLSIGKVGIARRPMYTNEAIAHLPVLDPERLHVDYLVRALDQADLAGRVDRAAMGSTLNKDKLKAITIPLPPIEQQRRIAAILDQADELRAKRRVSLSLLDSLTESIFLEMFGHREASIVSLRSLLAEAPVFTDGDWVESKDQDPEGDVRLIQLADVGDKRFLDKSSRFLTSAKARELKCTYLEAGDILVARMPDPLGRACLFPGLKRRCVTVVDVCIIRVDSARVDPTWLVHALNKAAVRNQIARRATGTTRSRISRGNLADVEVAVPPLQDQREFAGTLTKLSSTTSRIISHEDLLDTLFASIQHRAFRGEL